MLRALREQNRIVGNKENRAIRASWKIATNSDLDGVHMEMLPDEGLIVFSGSYHDDFEEEAQLAVINLIVNWAYSKGGRSWEGFILSIRSYRGNFKGSAIEVANALEHLLDEYNIDKTEPLSTISIQKIKLKGKWRIALKPYRSR